MADDSSKEAVRTGQIQRLIDLGFPRRLDLADDEYAARFPALQSVPLPRAGHFDLLVAVDPLVDLGFQHQAVGIKEAVAAARLVTAGGLPSAPYFIWVCDSRRWSGASMEEARVQFSEVEAGCSQLEVTSAFIHYPVLFRGRGLDADLTEDGERPGYHSTLIWVQDPPEIALHHQKDRTLGLGVLTRAK